MTSARIALLRDVLERGVGAPVVVETDNSGVRTGLRCYFAGLTANQGPVCTVRPSGLKRHEVTLRFGRFSGDCIAQMQAASGERQAVARALVASVYSSHEGTITPEQPPDSWIVTGPEFGLKIAVRDVPEPLSEEALARTAGIVMVPLLAAMAELIGYDEVEEHLFDSEGDVIRAAIARRERSPRNRLLCLSIHGARCAACGLAPGDRYCDAGDIIEVHHLEPLGMLSAPRPYDPRTDLVPLCPNCHRAVHTRRPTPFTIEELRERVAGAL